MRTTLILDDDVFAKAKKSAQESGTSLSHFISTTLRGHLLSKKSLPALSRVRVPTFRGSTLSHPHSLAEISKLRDEGR
jgi:hypothetical protein